MEGKGLRACEHVDMDPGVKDRVKKLIEQEDLASVMSLFKALSDETRLKITYALVHEEELCVCHVAQIIGASVATTSHHLRFLRSLGLAKSRRKGRLVFYSLDDDHVRMLVETARIHALEVKEDEPEQEARTDRSSP